MALSGRFRSSLIIGGQGIRARKLRTFLSMVSLFLGVLAVVVVQAAAGVAERAMMADVELTSGVDGTRQMYVSARSTATVRDTLRGRTDAVATSSVHAVIGEPHVRVVNEGGAPFDNSGGYGPEMTCDESGCRPVSTADATAPPGQAIELTISSLTGDVRRFRPFRPVAGRWLDFTADPSLSPALVLNKEAAKGFNKYRVPAEMSVDHNAVHATPRIIGVIDDGGREPAAYARADELQRWAPEKPGGDNGVSVLLAPTATDLEHILVARLAAGGASRDELRVEVIDSKERKGRELSIMRWVFTGLASLVLLIGVAGILNVGLATVGERVEEFALRRAVGTPRTLLAGIVLAETLLTGLLTAGAAVGVAALGLRIATAFLVEHEPALANVAFPWEAGVGGMVAGLAAGVLGGFVPAIRAARIPIATVMRA